ARIGARQEGGVCPSRDEAAVGKRNVVQVVSGGGHRSPSNEVRASEYFSAVTYRHICQGAGYSSERHAVHPGTSGTTTRNGGRRSPRIAVGALQNRAVRAQRNELADREHYRTEIARESVRDRRRLSPCSHAGRILAGVVEVAREDGR